MSKELILLIISGLLLIQLIIRCTRTKENPNLITNPSKYIIDTNDGHVTVYEFDQCATHACKFRKHYYTRYIHLDDVETTDRISVSNIRNNSFIYTDSVEKLYDILKSKNVLLEWMMTRINV